MIDSMVFMLEIIDMVLIMAAVIGAAYIKLFVVNELDELHGKVEHLAAENEQLKAKQRVYEKRLIKMHTPEEIVFKHEYSERNSPTYGGF